MGVHLEECALGLVFKVAFGRKMIAILELSEFKSDVYARGLDTLASFYKEDNICPVCFPADPF